jgi:ABC-type taurine transport system substrate-binding protein
LFEKEWNQVLNDELALQALAIITHALHRPSVEELTRLLGQDKERVEAMLAGIAFLTIGERTSEVSFVSDAFRKFATTQLRDRRQQVIDLIIDDLTARPESVGECRQPGESAAIPAKLVY